jgi:hypothetical protein
MSQEQPELDGPVSFGAYLLIASVGFWYGLCPAYLGGFVGVLFLEKFSVSGDSRFWLVVGSCLVGCAVPLWLGGIRLGRLSSIACWKLALAVCAPSTILYIALTVFGNLASLDRVRGALIVGTGAMTITAFAAYWSRLPLPVAQKP